MEFEAAYNSRKAACDLIGKSPFVLLFVPKFDALLNQYVSEQRKQEVDFSRDAAAVACEALETVVGGNSFPAKAACIQVGTGLAHALINLRKTHKYTSRLIYQFGQLLMHLLRRLKPHVRHTAVSQ